MNKYLRFAGNCNHFLRVAFKLGAKIFVDHFVQSIATFMEELKREIVHKNAMQFHHKSKQNNLTKNWIRNGRMSVDSVKLWKCIIFPTEGIRQYWTFLNHRFEPCNRVYISLAHPSNHFKCNMKKTRKKFNYHKRRDFFLSSLLSDPFASI